jgi:hypothetical protein
MSASEVIEEIKKLPSAEQQEIFVFLAEKVIANREPKGSSLLGKKLSFEEACDVVFRENRELLALLAK